MIFTFFKELIREVSEIATSAREEFRQKGFDLLMTHLLTAADYKPFVDRGLAIAAGTA